MYTDLCEERYVDVFVDEQKNIAVFSKTSNPKYDKGDEESLMYVSVKKPIELKYPYTYEELSNVIKKSIELWNQGEPYINNEMSIEEYYYNIKGFKNATYRKKFISVGWDDIGGKQVCLYIALKNKKYYLGIASTQLSDDADWDDFAKVIMEYINIDLTRIDAYKTYKNKLNY